jgi:hypothetical protein
MNDSMINANISEGERYKKRKQQQPGGPAHQTKPNQLRDKLTEHRSNQASEPTI